MGYTPDDQRLEPAIDQILEGIAKFQLAAAERMRSKDYSDSEIDKLMKWRKNLMNLERRLIEYRRTVY